MRICRQVAPADASYVSDEWEAAEDIRQALLADNRAVVRVPDRVRTGFENVPNTLWNVGTLIPPMRVSGAMRRSPSNISSKFLLSHTEV